MSLFTEYIERRKMHELAELSVRHGIDLEPLVELSRQIQDSGLAPEEAYHEFFQQAANVIGVLAGKALRGVGNLTENFAQGWRQGGGQSEPQQPQAGQRIQQPAAGPQGGNNPSIQVALHQLQSLKQNLQVLARASQQQATQLSQHLQGTMQEMDKISQMMQQVLQDRHGIAWKPQ